MIITIAHFSVSGKKSSSSGSPSKQQPRYRQQQQQQQQQNQQHQQQIEVHSTSPEENVPSYMRSTSASAKKERPVSAASIATFNTPRRRPSFGQTQSQLDLRTAASDEDSSSEENLQRSKNRRRSSSHDRR